MLIASSAVGGSEPACKGVQRKQRERVREGDKHNGTADNQGQGHTKSAEISLRVKSFVHDVQQIYTLNPHGLSYTGTSLVAHALTVYWHEPVHVPALSSDPWQGLNKGWLM